MKKLIVLIMIIASFQASSQKDRSFQLGIILKNEVTKEFQTALIYVPFILSDKILACQSEPFFESLVLDARSEVVDKIIKEKTGIVHFYTIGENKKVFVMIEYLRLQFEDNPVAFAAFGESVKDAYDKSRDEAELSGIEFHEDNMERYFLKDVAIFK